MMMLSSYGVIATTFLIFINTSYREFLCGKLKEFGNSAIYGNFLSSMKKLILDRYYSYDSHRFRINEHVWSESESTSSPSCVLHLRAHGSVSFCSSATFHLYLIIVLVFIVFFQNFYTDILAHHQGRLNFFFDY
uniref:Uncharacterized protein n=1 Tax=Heterorhabditis bacteriophora TaxID=37862 RepID=A0A1I7WLT1_HETBA